MSSTKVMKYVWFISLWSLMVTMYHHVTQVHDLGSIIILPSHLLGRELGRDFYLTNWPMEIVFLKLLNIFI